MNNEKSAPAATENPETSHVARAPSARRSPSAKKSSRSKNSTANEEKVPMTFSFSISLAKRLKMLSGSLDESTSDYVELKLAPIVARDLKRVLEEME